MFAIDYSKLHKLESAFIIYEVASHGVDPRETLVGTTLRIKNREGYKQGVYDELHKMIENGGPYTDILLKAFNNNLASYRQKPNIERIAASEDAELLETVLTDLYEGSDDESAFNELVDIIGGYFDVLGLIFFLKDCENYLPIRSELFDERFKQIGVDSKLSHNCTWDKYQEYNSAIKEIQQDLRQNINASISLIDAHSFVWVLNGVAKYTNSVNQPVEHKTLGKGVIIDSDDETITVKFSNSKNPTTLLKSIAIDEGKLTFLDPGFDIDAPNVKQDKNSDLKDALADNKNTKPNKYLVINSTNSKDEYLNGYLRAPYFDYSGKKRYYWDTLSDLKPGDILFHYQYPCIRAVSIVSSSCYDVPISDLHGETEEWGDTRRQVEFSPFVLDEPIKIADYKNEIIKYKRDKNMNSAFNKNGGVVEGYVHELEPEIADLFEKAIGIEIPKKENDKDSHVVGTFSSWTVKGENIAIKQCDKSFFDYRGSTIPRDVYWFFGADNLAAGEKKNIKLRYYDEEYSAYLQRENLELARIRIFWEQSLADEFDEYNTPGKYPKLIFTRDTDDTFIVGFDENSALSKKATEVAEALLKLIAKGTRLTTYGELSNMTESKPSAYYEMRMLLDAINRRCESLGLPCISAMVVNKDTKLPGPGFKDVCVEVYGYDQDMSTEEIFEAELDRIIDCERWYVLADYLGFDIPGLYEYSLPDDEIDSLLNANPQPIRKKQKSADSKAIQKKRDDEYPREFVTEFNISKEQWIELLDDPAIFKDSDIDLLKRIYLRDNHAMTAFDLSLQEGTHPSSYIMPVVGMAKRVSKALDLPPIYRDSNGKRYWWRIIFWGRGTDDGHFEWKINPALAEALAEIYPELDQVAPNEKEDEELVDYLKQASLKASPKEFVYVNEIKEKAEPVYTEGHKVYPRDRQTAINALAHAGYKCEIDPDHHTFIRKNSDKPYTEPHHLIPMAFSDDFDVSLDVEQNIVSLCSNCHNEIHYGRDAEDLITQLYDDRKDLLSAVGIVITLDELLEMYGIYKD